MIIVRRNAPAKKSKLTLFSISFSDIESVPFGLVVSDKKNFFLVLAPGALLDLTDLIMGNKTSVYWKHLKG